MVRDDNQGEQARKQARKRTDQHGERDPGNDSLSGRNMVLSDNVQQAWERGDEERRVE